MESFSEKVEEVERLMAGRAVGEWVSIPIASSLELQALIEASNSRDWTVDTTNSPRLARVARVPKADRGR